MNKDVKWIPGTGAALTFDAITGFAINPSNETAIAFAADFRDVLLTVVGTGNVIVYGSTQKDPPDFTIPSTITNSYAAIRLNDYTTIGAGSFLDGTTGITVAGATAIVELDTNLLTWCAIHRSANTVDVKMTITNAQ